MSATRSPVICGRMLADARYLLGIGLVRHEAQPDRRRDVMPPAGALQPRPCCSARDRADDDPFIAERGVTHEHVQRVHQGLVAAPSWCPASGPGLPAAPHPDS